MAESTHPVALAVGVDGGGTSTRILIVDAHGARLGSGTSGSGNLHDVGEVRLRENIREAWQAAWEEAGDGPRRCDSVFCAMASVGTPGNRETIQRIVAEVGLGALENVTVDVDLAGALAGGLGGQPGIALIAGTGSSCYGRDRSGATFQSGGWGSLLDDVGGATWIGTQAMVAAIRAFDRRGESTALEAMVMDHFAMAHMRELLPKIDADGSARRERAQLAKLVTRAAAAGDGVAAGILERGADALAECAEAVSAALGFDRDETCEVVVTGGLAENVPAYRDLVHRAVERRLGNASCVLPRMSNVEGAAELARRALPSDGCAKTP